MSDLEIYTQLCNSVNDDFEKYDSINISYLMIYASGFNGRQVRERSVQILDKYSQWISDNPDYRISNLFTNENIDKIIQYINNHELNDKDENKLLDYLDNIYLSLGSIEIS